MELHAHTHRLLSQLVSSLCLMLLCLYLCLYLYVSSLCVFLTGDVSCELTFIENIAESTSYWIVHK